MLPCRRGLCLLALVFLATFIANCAGDTYLYQWTSKATAALRTEEPYEGGRINVRERSPPSCVPCGVGQPYCCDAQHICCFPTEPFGNPNFTTSCTPVSGGQCCVSGQSCGGDYPDCCGDKCMPSGSTCCGGVEYCPLPRECREDSSNVFPGIDWYCNSGNVMTPALSFLVLQILAIAIMYIFSF